MTINSVSAEQMIAQTDTLKKDKQTQTNNTTNVSVWVNKIKSLKETAKPTAPTVKEVEDFNKQEKIKKREAQIRKIESRLQMLESALYQDKITYIQYQNQMDTPLKKLKEK